MSAVRVILTYALTFSLCLVGVWFIMVSPHVIGRAGYTIGVVILVSGIGMLILADTILRKLQRK